MSPRGRSVAGPILIVLGLVMLLQQLGALRLGILWLVGMMVVGLGLLVLYARGQQQAGILAASVWLILFSLHLLFVAWDWIDLDRSWPFFFMAPGLALLAVAAQDRTNRDALTPAGALIGLACFFYLFSLGIVGFLFDIIRSVLRVLMRYVLPLALMGWGGWLIFVRRQGELGTVEQAFPEKIEPTDGVASPAAAPAGDPAPVVEAADEDGPPDADSRAESPAGLEIAEIEEAELEPTAGESDEDDEPSPTS